MGVCPSLVYERIDSTRVVIHECARLHLEYVVYRDSCILQLLEKSDRQKPETEIFAQVGSVMPSLLVGPGRLETSPKGVTATASPSSSTDPSLDSAASDSSSELSKSSGLLRSAGEEKLSSCDISVAYDSTFSKSGIGFFWNLQCVVTPNTSW